MYVVKRFFSITGTYLAWLTEDFDLVAFQFVNV